MRWTCVVVVIGALAGCGSPSCKEAIDKAMAATHDEKLPTRAIVAACEKDGWSGEVRTCLSKVTSNAEAEACLANVESVGTAVREQREAELKAARAEAEAMQAVKDAQAAKEGLEKVEKDLDTLNSRIDEAVSAVANAQNDADRAAAVAKLKALQREQYEIKQRAEAARAAAMQAERSKGVHISKECLDNPLAKGCS